VPWPVGFQTYTWQARLQRGHPLPSFEQIVDLVASAGYNGLETSTTVLGRLLEGPAVVRAALASAGIRLVALAFSPASGWTDPSAGAADLAAADRLIAFLQELGPGQSLAIGLTARPSRRRGSIRPQVGRGRPSGFRDASLRCFAAPAARATGTGCWFCERSDDRRCVEWRPVPDRVCPTVLSLAVSAAMVRSFVIAGAARSSVGWALPITRRAHSVLTGVYLSVY